MDIMELGAIGELVGGATVLVTLIYLSSQLRQGNEIAKDNASQIWTEFNFDLAGRVAIDRSLAEVWVRGGDRFDELDAVDRQRVIFYEWRAIDAFHHAFHQHKRGILPDHQWNKILWITEGLIGDRQAVQEAWRTFRDSYDTEFREMMDQCLAR